MAFSFGPSALKDNLVLYLDAINPNSYPGYGTTWYDLSNNNNNFILSGAPTYTGTYFNFNTSQAAICVNTTCGNFGSSSFTIEYITQYTSSGGASDCLMLKRNGGYIAPGAAGYTGWCYRIGSNAWWAQDDTPGGAVNNFVNVVGSVSFPPKSTSLVHMVYTIEKNGTSTTGSTYTNGVLTDTDKKVFVGTNSVSNSSTMYIALGMTGSIAMVRMYDKKLSSIEVTQNFNSIKGRFGL